MSVAAEKPRDDGKTARHDRPLGVPRTVEIVRSTNYLGASPFDSADPPHPLPPMTHAIGCPSRRPILLLLVALPASLACDSRPGASGGGTADPAPDATAADSVADRTRPAPRVEADGLVIEDLLVAEPVTGERAALYLTVRSTGGDVLLDLEATGADSASLHETSTVEGVMRMRPVAEIAVPAGGEVALRPGGLHGMLEGLSARWVTGDTVRLRLRFRDAGVVEAPALVIPYIELDTRFREAAGGG